MKQRQLGPKPSNDWARDQMEAICDQVVCNPWVASVLGLNINVSVQISNDGRQLAFLFVKDDSAHH